GPTRPAERELARFALAGFGGVMVLLLALSAPVASTGWSWAIADTTSASELSILLFTLYAAVATVPLLRAADRLAREPGPSDRPAAPAPRVRHRPGSRSRRPVPLAAAAVALLILGPGAAVTVTGLPAYAGELYHAFGNVSAADFALLAWAGGHLPDGARVLVAPGSAAGFLPGYLPTATVLFPMAEGTSNATYRALVTDLDAGRLTPQDRADLAELAVGYVAVTQNNTHLDAPFDPAPLWADPAGFPVLFDEDDAVLFAVTTPTG
ncbi:MAG: hypothetical protein ACREC5_08235, partial [Thermoplasmata archaeon]